jgi:ABC-type polysaccharide/polyol phosphate export permease
MFPLEGAAPWIRAFMHMNPMAYCVSGIRRALSGGSLLTVELAVTAGFAALATLLAVWMCTRRARRP